MKKPNALFWILGVVFLLWNAFGCVIYIIDKAASDAQYAEMYGEAMLATRDVYPLWATAAYAIAVWGGLLAAIFLLLRKRHAAPLFVASLIGAVISFIPVFTESAFKEASGSTYWVMPIIVVLLGLFEVWWSRRARANGILN
ncbi:MAG: hypothetical protein AAFP97_02105 [Pseudomonadota bacterium]